MTIKEAIKNWSMDNTDGVHEIWVAEDSNAARITIRGECIFGMVDLDDLSDMCETAKIRFEVSRGSLKIHIDRIGSLAG